MSVFLGPRGPLIEPSMSVRPSVRPSRPARKKNPDHLYSLINHRRTTVNLSKEKGKKGKGEKEKKRKREKEKKGKREKEKKRKREKGKKEKRKKGKKEKRKKRKKGKKERGKH